MIQQFTGSYYYLPKWTENLYPHRNLHMGVYSVIVNI